MRKTSLIQASALSLVLAAGFTACGGSTSSEGFNLGGACSDGSQMCVVSCTLGCTSGSGCTISEIAVNQPLRFQFSRPIDPATVNSETFSIRTVGGAQPSGTYVVQGNEVAFVPSVRSEGNQTLFGFAANTVYNLEIRGVDSGSTNLLRSVDGGALGANFSCQIEASRGVIDLDGENPTAQLLVPTQLTDIERNTLIVLEFSEVLNTQIFQGGGAGAGILYTVSLIDENEECERRVKNLPGSVSVNIDELTNKTTVVFRPSILLPQNSCVQVQVTSQIRDLSGKGAVPVAWEFRTKREQVQSQFIEEKFNNTTFFDTGLSGALWGSGKLEPGKIGGTGILGDFTAADGTATNQKDAKGRDIYEWNADGQKIPAIRTLTGEDIIVNNGVFEFSTFTVKANERVRFVGSRIPKIIVSGKVQIDGAIDMVVPGMSTFNPDPNTGQPGGPGVCGGGSGGQGGDRPTLPNGDRNGRAGQDIQLPAGHPRAAQAAGTGGGGSLANPQTGLTPIWISLGGNPIFCRQTAAGGAGGSFYSPNGTSFLGTNGTTRVEGLVQYPIQNGEAGVNSTPGKSFAVVPEISGRSSAETFAIGGSGGGGGGADPFNSFYPTASWNAGGGGAGGGGALILQCGGDLVLGRDAELVARGGNAPDFGNVFSQGSNLAPGGGGSGGSFLLQTAGVPTLLGTINVEGGFGGRIAETTYLSFASLGGNGGAGYIRVEADPAPSHTSFSGFTPAATPDNVGQLRNTDFSDVTVAVSKWYQTQSLFSPSIRYYVIEAKIDGNPITYSDLVTVSTNRATANEPVTFLIQSGPVNQAGVPIDDVTPWVEDDLQLGGINRINGFENEIGNGIRFMIRLNRGNLPNPLTSTVEVTNVQVYYRG